MAQTFFYKTSLMALGLSVLLYGAVPAAAQTAPRMQSIAIDECLAPGAGNCTNTSETQEGAATVETTGNPPVTRYCKTMKMKGKDKEWYEYKSCGLTRPKGDGSQHPEENNAREGAKRKCNGGQSTASTTTSGSGSIDQLINNDIDFCLAW